MANCRYCNSEMEEKQSFCGKCGNFGTSENNVFMRVLKRIGTGIKNPSAFIRNSKGSDIVTTGIMFGIIILISIVDMLILKKSSVGSFANSKSYIMILFQIITMVVFIGVLFIGIKIQKVSKVNLLSVTNLLVHASIFVALFSFIGLLLVFISPILGGMAVCIGSLIYYILIYQGLRESYGLDEKSSFITLIGTHFVVVFILYLVVSLLG